MKPFWINASAFIFALFLMGCGSDMENKSASRLSDDYSVSSRNPLSADEAFLGSVSWLDESGQQHGFFGELTPTATGISLGSPKDQGRESRSERAFSVLGEGNLMKLRCGVSGQQKYCKIGGKWVVCGCDEGSGNPSANNCTWSEVGC